MKHFYSARTRKERPATANDHVHCKLYSAGIFLFLLSFLPAELFAVTRTWTGLSSPPNTLWTDGNNWSGGVAPAANDDVVFTPAANIIVTAVQGITLNSLRVNGSSDVTLQAAGNITLTIANSIATNDLDIQSGSLTLSTNVSLTMASGSNAVIAPGATLNIAAGRTFTLTNAATTTAVVGGTLNVNGTLTLGAASVMTVNGTINAQTSAAITSSAASLSFSSTGVYNHQRDQGTIPAAAYNAGSLINVTGIIANYPAFPAGVALSNLTWDCAGQTATNGLNTPVTINENFSILAGTFIDNGRQITGNSTYTFTIASGAGLVLGTGTATSFPLDFTTANISLHAGSTVTYASTAAQNISNVPAYGNLVINGSNTKTLLGDLTINGDLTVNSSTLWDNGFDITGTAGKTLTLANASTAILRLGNTTVATGFPTSFGTISLGLASAVQYNSNVAQTISSVPTYGNLTLSGTAGTKTADGNILVDGALTINAGNTLNDGGYIIDLNGALANSGTHTGTGKILLSGTAAQAITGTPAVYGNLETANAAGVTFSSTGTAQVTGDINVASGLLSIGAFTTSLMANGTVTVSGTLNITSTTGTKTFTDIIINNGATWSNGVNEPITINGNLTNDGTFTAGTGVHTFAGAGKTISGSTSPLNIASLTSNGTCTNNVSVLNVATALAGVGTFTMGANTTLNLTGTFTTANLDATTNTPNTVVYNNTAAAQTVKGATYYNLTIAKTAQTATAAAPGITVNNNLTITSGRLNDGGYQITGNGTGIFTMGAGTTLTIGATGSANNTAFPTGYPAGNISLDATSLVNYNANAPQTISAAPEYGNLTLTASAASTKTAAGDITVNTNLVIGGNNTLADGGNTILVKGNLTNSGAHSGSGRILLAAGSAQHTFAGTGGYSNLELDDALGALVSVATTINGNLTITSGTMTVANVALTVAAASTASISGTLTKTSATGAMSFGNLVVNSGGTFSNTGNSAVTINGNFQNNGTFTSGTGTYTLAGAAKTLSGTTAPLSFNNLTSNGTYTNNVSTLNVAGVLAGAGTFTMGANTILNLSGNGTVLSVANLNATANTPNTVVYNSTTGAQNVKGTTYYNLTIDKGTQTATLAAITSIANDLTINSGTLADGGFVFTGPGAGAGTFNMNSGNTVAFTMTNTGTNPFPVFQAYNFHSTASTVNYNGNTTIAQTVSALPDYGNLSVLGGSGAGNKTAGGAITVNGNLSITTLAFADAGNTVSVKGNITNNSGHTGTGKILLTGGTAAHTLSGTGAYFNLELDDAQGANMAANFTINGTLTLTNGTFAVGGSSLTLAGQNVAGNGANISTTASSTVIFSGSTTGITTPVGITNLGNLTIANANGVTLGNTITVNAANGLTLTTGRLSLGNNDFIYGVNSATTSGTYTANNMIISDATAGSGQVKKIFPASTNVTFTFPIGDNTGTVEYSPVVFTAFNSSVQRTIGVVITDGVHAQINNPNAQTNYISRYWTFSDDQAGNGTYSYNGLSFSIVNTADLVGTVSTANDQINRWDGLQWNQMASTVTTATAPAPYTAATSIAHNETTGTLDANDFTLRFNNQQTYTWNGVSGSWATPTNWTPTRNTPLTTDILLFNSGNTITVTDVPTQTVTRLTINNSTDVTFTSTGARTLSIANTAGTNFTVAAGSSLRLSSTGTNSIGINFLGANPLTSIAGLIELNPNASNNNSISFLGLTAATNIITGTITNNGGVVTGGATAAAATPTLGAGATYNHTMDGGTLPFFLWNATSSCNVTSTTTGPTVGASQNFGHLNINTGGSATTTMNGAITVSGNLQVLAGTFYDGGFQIAGNAARTLTVASGATLRINTAFPTNYTNPNIILQSGSTVNFTGAAQNVSNVPTYSNLSINVGAGSGIKTAAGILNINGDLTVATGILYDNGFAINGTATGTLALTSNGTLRLGTTTVATSYPASFGTHNLSPTSTVNYNATITGQNISPVPVYGHLTTTASATTLKVKTLQGNVTVLGNFTNAAWISVNLNGYKLDISGTYSNSGTMVANAANSGIILSGNNPMTFTIGTYNPANLANFTVNKTAGATVTLGSALTMGTGTLNVQSGTLSNGTFQITGNAAGFLTVASGATLRISITTATLFPTNYVKANITLQPGSTVHYAATANQSISSVPNYANLTISGTGIKTVTTPGPLNISGNLTINAGTLADGGFQINGNSTGTLTMAGATGLTLGTTGSATQFPTNFTTANISIASNGTVTYNSNAAQNVSAVPVYGNLVTVATAAVTKTMQGDVTVLGNFTNGANNTFHLNGNTLSLSGAYTNSGILRGDVANSTLSLDGANPITFTIGNYTSTTLANFTTNRPGAVTLGSSLVVGNNFTLNGPFNVAGFTLTLNGPPIAGTATNLSTTTASNLIFGGSSSGVFIPTSVANLSTLTVNNANGVAMSASLNLNNATAGALTLTNGALSIGSNTLTLINGGISYGAGTLTGGATSNLTLAGTGLATTLNAVTNGLQNLSLQRTTAGTLTLGADLTLTGDLGINYNNTLADNGRVLTVNGNSINHGTHSGTGKILLAGGSTAHTLIGAGAYGNLELDDANGVDIPSSTPISWAAVPANTSVTSNGTITKISGTTAWGESGAGGTQKIFTGGSIQCQGGQTNTRKMFGFDCCNPDNNYLSMDYALYLTDGGAVQVYQNGSSFGTYGSYTTSDVFQVRLNANNEVEYVKNGAVFYTSLIPPTLPLMPDMALYQVNTSFTGMTISPQTIIVNGTLTLTDGSFPLGSNTLILNGPSIGGTASNLSADATSNIIYGGSSAGVNIPAHITDLSHLHVNNTNAAGVTMNNDLTLHATSPYTLNLAGKLFLGSHDLILASTTARVSGTFSAAAMVVADGSGELKKTFPASTNTTFIFPVGDQSGVAPNNTGADYSPVTLTNFNSSVQRVLGVKVQDDIHAQNGTQTHYVSRIWQFSDDQSGTGTYTYAPLALSYSATANDANGTAANFKINRWDGSQWTQLNSTVAGTTVSSNGTYSETTGTLGGNDFVIRVTPSQTYTWVPTSGTGDWNTITNWSPPRYSPQPNDILQFSNGGTPTANNIPAQTIAQLLVSNNTDVTLQSAAANILSISGTTATTNLSVASGSTLQIGGGAFLLTVRMNTTAGQMVNIAGTLNLNNNSVFSNGTATTAVSVPGAINVHAGGSYIATNTITTVASGGSITNNGGTITSTAANLIFDNGSTYNHAMNGGTIPTATYYRASPLINSSTVNITGITANNLTGGLTGSFSNLNWNCAGQQLTADGRVNGAITVYGNLAVQAGTLSNNGNLITGNAAGTFSVAAGASFTTTRTAAPLLPSLFTTITLDPTSTINYNGGITTIQNNPNGAVTLTTYGHLGIQAGNAVKTLSTPLTVNNLIVTSGTLADGGNTITVNGNLNVSGTHSGAGKILLTGGSAAHDVYGGGVVGNLELDDANGAVIPSVTSPIAWTAISSNGSVTGNGTITKISGTNAWNSGAGGNQKIYTGGFIQCQGGQTTTAKMFGLDCCNPDNNYTTIDYAIYLANGGSVLVYENGANLGTYTTYLPTDVFQVRVNASNQVEYVKNGSVFYTSLVPPTLPLMPDLSLNTVGASFTNMAVSPQTITVSGTLTLTDGTFTVGANTLILNGPAIAGTATNLTAGATSNLIFGGASAGVNIPSNITQLSALGITNTNVAGVTLNSSLTLNSNANGALSLGGRLFLGSNDLTLAGPASLVGGTFSATSMVVADGTGQLKKTFPAGIATSFTFPVGDNSGIAPNNTGADYSPLVLTNMNSSIERTIGLSVTDDVHTQNGAQTHYVSRIWTITDDEAGNGTYSYTGLSLAYSAVTTDAVGTAANYKINRWDPSGVPQWYQLNSSGGATTVTTSTYTETSGPLGNFDFALRVNAPTAYTWIPTSGTHDFQVATNWAPPRYAQATNDILQFLNGGASTANNVPTQTITVLYVDNATDITLEGISNNTLTINDHATLTDLDIQDGAVTIGSNLNITLGATGNPSDAYISGDGVLTISTGRSFALTALSGTTAVVDGTINVDGTLTTTTTAGVNMTVNGSMNNTGALSAITSNGTTLVFDNGSSYNHMRNGGAIPTATFYRATAPVINNTTINVTGITSTNLTGLAGTISHLIWNCLGQTADGRISGALTVNGDLQILAGTLFNNNNVITGTATGTFTVASGAAFTTSRIATPWFPANIPLANITLDDNSTVNFDGTNGATAFTLSGIPTTYGHLAFRVGGIKTLPAASAFTVNGNLSITAGTLADNGTIITVKGNLTNAGVHSGAGKILLANGSAVHNISGGGTCGNLELNDTFGAALTGNITIGTANVLTLTDGLLSLGNFNLTINNTNNTTAIAGTPSASSMIVTDGAGLLVKNFAAGAQAAFTYPIGETTGTTEYTPVTITFGAGTVTGRVGMGVVDGDHGSLGGAVNYLSRYWRSAIISGMATHAYTISFNYIDPDDINGTLAAINAARWDGVNWNPYTSTNGSATLAITSTPLNNTTASLNNADFTGRETALTYHFRSFTSGNWNSVNTWEASIDPTFPVGSVLSPAPFVPDENNSLSILIRSNHQVAVTTNTSADQLTIDNTANSRLTINNGVTFTVVNNPAGNDLTLLGGNSRLDVYGTLVNQGQIAGSSTTNTRFYDTGIYQHDQNGGTVPAAAWNAPSECLITGVTTTAPTGFSTQVFGKFTWNCTGQTASPLSLGAASITSNGDFRLVSTGSSSNVVTFNTAACTATLNGNLLIEDGTLSMNNGTNTVTTLNLAGNYTQTGGTFQRGTSTGTQAFNFSNAATSRSYTQTAGTINTTGIAFTVNTNAIVTLASDLNVTQLFTVNGTLHTGTQTLSGAGAFTLSSNGTLGIGSPNGITTVPTAAGNIQTATRTYNTAANYTYNGSATQVTGNGLTTCRNLTVDNAAGVMLVNAVFVSTQLILNNGVLQLGDYDLILSNTASTAVAGNTLSATNMVATNGVGQLSKAFPAAAFTAFTYPVGDITGTAEYSPVTLTATVNSVARTIGVRVEDARHPGDMPLTVDYLSRYWKMTCSNTAGNYTLTADYTYTAADVNGTEANLEINRFDPIGTQSWVEYAASTVTPPVLSVSGITQANGFLLSEFDITGRKDVVSYYRSVTTGNWNAASTWEVSSDPAFISPAPVPATTPPTVSNSDGVLVRTGHTVTVTNILLIDDLTVDGTLTVNSGIPFTVNNGASATDMVLNGTMNIDGILNINTGALFTVNGIMNNLPNSGAFATTAATLNFASGSLYDHQRNSAAVMAATWDPASTCKISSPINPPVSGINQVFGGFTLATNITASLHGATTVAGELTLTAGTLSIGANTLNLNGTIAAGGTGKLSGIATSTVVVGGSGTGSMGAVEFATGGQTLNVLTMNRTGGSIFGLSTPITVNTLNLTNGIVSNGSNNLTVGSFTGGSANSYVSGVVVRTIPASSSGLTVGFPVGNANYNLIEIVSPTTNSGGPVVISAEVTDAASGGTAGAGVATLDNRYWQMSILSGAASLTSRGSIRVTDPSISSSKVLSQAAAQTGIYNYIGNTVGVQTLTSTYLQGTAYGYFAVGDKGSLCGTYTVGNTTAENFRNLTDVRSALSIFTVDCDVYFELTGNYSSSAPAEVYPLTFNTFTYGAGGPFDVTIRPASGVTSLIAGSNGTALINIDGADRLTFDGRQGGTGTSKSLTISNLSTAGSTIRFINDAQNNTIRHCAITGVTTGANGVISISTAVSGTQGNDGLLIDNCNLSNGATVPTNLIYAVGTAGKENSGITISNNNFFNFSASGVNVTATGNGSDWTISGNHFYNTVTQATAQTPINFSPGALSQNNSIVNNTIGGQAANAAGSPWTNSGAVAFTGILVSAGTTTATTVDGNVIKNISLTSAGASSFTGINAAAGSLNVGLTSGNTIGDANTANSILVAGTGLTLGINSAASTVSIAKNQIANMHASGTGTAVAVRGIVTSSTGVQSVTENTVQKLSTTSTNVGTGASSSVVGISHTATGANSTVGGNTVHTLSNNAATAAVAVTGIHYAGPTTGSNAVERNFVHSLALSSSNGTASITGIAAAAGNTEYRNNMVRLGINAAGSSINTGNVMYGINETGGTNNFYFNSVYMGGSATTATSGTFAFNSTLASGTRSILNNIFFNARSTSAGTGKNYAMKVATLAGLTSNYNDLLSTGTAAVTVANGATEYPTLRAWFLATVQDAQSFSIDPGFIAPAANAAGVDLHIQAPPLKTPVEAVGTSVASVAEDFDGEARGSFTPVDVGADAGNFDYLDMIPPVITYTLIPDNNSSTAIPYVFNDVQITDFSGVNVTSGTKPRLYYKKSTHTNTYAGNTSADNGWKYVEATNASSPFTFTFDYTILFGGGVAMNDIIQYFVVAQDMSPDQINVGINSGTFNVTPNSVNLTATAFPLTTPPVINSFVIKLPFGTVTVGTTGADFTSFTRAGGLFQAINSSTLLGDITVRVITDITNEDGANGLNQWAETPAGSNFTLTITPDSDVMRTVAGSYSGTAATNAGLFRLNGADRVTIDGRDPVALTGMYLTFKNSNAAVSSFNSTFNFFNDASDNAIRYCDLQGASRGSSTPGGVVRFSAAATGSGNDNIVIEFCNIHDDAIGGKPAIGIVSEGTNTAGKENSGITITNNNIYNFYTTDGVAGGIRIANGANARGSENWTITDNSFYQEEVVNTSISLDYKVIYIDHASNSGFVVERNYIGGREAECGGLEWMQEGGPNSFEGIVVNAASSSIQGNMIRNISISSEKDLAENTGINVPGGSSDIGTVTGNMIGSDDLSTAKGIIFQSSGNTPKLTGIAVGSGNNGTLYNVQNNTVAGLSLPSGSTVAVKNAVTTADLNTSTGTTTTITYTGNFTGTNQPTADGRDKGYYNGPSTGNDEGLTINLSNNNYTAVNAFWGMSVNPSPAFIVGNVLGAPGPDPNNPGCIRPGNLTYNSSAADRANGKAVFTGSTSYRVRVGNAYSNVAMNIRMTVTVTNSGGIPVAIVYDGFNNLINVPFTQALKVNIFMETQTPSSITFLYSTTYPSSGSLSPNTWYPSIWLYNKINTDAGYKICTGVDWSLYAPGATQSGNVIAHTPTTVSTLNSLTGTTTTILYTGKETGVNQPTADGRDKGLDNGAEDGLIIDITNDNYSALDASWGIATNPSPAYIVGNEAGTPPPNGTTCDKPGNMSYNPALSNLSQGVAYFTGSATYRHVNSTGGYSNTSMNTRMRVEVETPGGTAIPLIYNNNVIKAPFNQPLKVRLLMETQTPATALPFGGHGTNAWVPSITLFNTIHTDPNTMICTGIDWGFYINGTTSEVVGISSSDGITNIENNIISTISSDVVSTLSGGAYGIKGISISSTDPGQTVARNTIYGLTTTGTIYPTSIAGIDYNGPLSGTNKVEKNFVHSFSSNTNDALQVGISATEGNAEFSNNIIRLGIRTDGSAVASSATITGILDASSNTNSNFRFYHNTVYIGGNGVTSDDHSHALRRTLTYGSGNNTVDIKNNIFMNERSTATGTGKNYGVQFDRVNGITSDYNLIYGTGSGYAAGRLSGDYADLAAWNTATGFEANSVEGDPVFRNATGGTPDLHIDTLTVGVALVQDTNASCMTLVLIPMPALSPADGKATPLASVSTDYDAETRDAVTPDIGADEFSNCVFGAGVWTANGGDSDWFNPENWSCQFVPDSTTHVIIPGGRPFYPDLYNATAACSTLTILNSASVTLTDAFDLDVQDSIHVDCSGALTVDHPNSTIQLGGDWKNFGDFTHGDSKVIFDGTERSLVLTNNKDFADIDITKGGLGSVVIPAYAENMKSALLQIVSGELVIEAQRKVTCTKGTVEVEGKVNVNTEAELRVEP